MMLNRIILIGRLTRDPEVRYTSSGTAVASFTMAVDRPFTNQAGNKETDFVDCVAWRKLGETVGNHLKKGRLVATEGRLQIRSYEAKDGTKRRVAEVIAENVRFLDFPKDGTANPDMHAGAGADTEAVPEDLPF